MQLFGIKMKSHWIRVGPKPNDLCLPREDTEVRTQMEREDHLQMEAKTRVMRLHANKHQEWPETIRSWKRQGRILP